MASWNPALYLKYEDERTQPSRDLVARIGIAAPARVVDIGCGPGNSTRILHERWPSADIVGLDSSPEMITRARQAYPEGNWLLADAAKWESDVKYDIVFSNATLQWIPGHETLLKRLFDHVNEDGALAVQIPANADSPLHQAMLQVARRTEWAGALARNIRALGYYDTGFYYDQLSALSNRVALWHTIYYHVMADHQDLIDWYASTGMRPYLEQLATDNERRAFQAQVRETCRPGYPAQQDGKILFPFKRLFFIAYNTR